MTALEKFTAPVGTALDRFIAQKQEHFAYATGELSQLLRDIALASKIINREINRAGLSGIEGVSGEENVQGEYQQKLDVVADVRFIRALNRGGETCAIVSEEEEEMIDTNKPNAKYLVTIDPLDGSSNIDVNVSLGTLFSVFRRKTSIGTSPTIEDALQPGKEQVAAGYILYGASTMLVYTTGFGVHGFTYEPSLGEYFLSHPNMKFKEEGNIYSVNEGQYLDFTPGVKRYIDLCRERRYKTRYIGSSVADFHRNLLKGGIFMYPSTREFQQGKLRLLYECNPLAFITEQAGGKATSGLKRILDIVPTDIHQRVPFMAGSTPMINEVIQCVSEHS